MMPRKCVLDVKWANSFRPREHFLQNQHFNPNYQLIAASEGPLYLQIEDEQWTLQAGDAIFLLPWQNHRGWLPNNFAGASGEFFWVQFQTSEKIAPLPHDPFAAEQNEPDPDDMVILPRFVHVPQRFKLLRLFEDLVAELSTCKRNYQFRSALLLGSILELLSTTSLEACRPDTSPSASYLLFLKTARFIENNFTSALDRTVFERHLQRSYYHLGQVFKKFEGVTILEYIQRLRIQRSKHLLLHTVKSIKEIAEEVGFRDAFYFCKVFKKSEGTAPSVYRTEHALKAN
jgi:AraC-like DNA-binding protein